MEVVVADIRLCSVDGRSGAFVTGNDGSKSGGLRAYKIVSNSHENASPAIERLGVPAYDWWNECLHGVARAVLATVFPEPIGMAATWDLDLGFRVATAISDEARAAVEVENAAGCRGPFQLRATRSASNKRDCQQNPGGDEGESADGRDRAEGAHAGQRQQV